MDDEKQSGLDVDDSDELNKLICIQSKLGQSKQEFAVKDLKKIQYFCNRLSGRWTDNNMITIASDDINFGVQELEQIVHFKNSDEIKSDYPLGRLPYLSSAFDYFAEKIDSDFFMNYFENRVPAIKHKQLIELKKQSQFQTCRDLRNTINFFLKQRSETVDRMNEIILENWCTVNSLLLVRNANIATSVFMQYYLETNDYDEDEYDEDIRPRFIMNREISDLEMLWQYIMCNELWKNNPDIIKKVFPTQKIETYDGKPKSKSVTKVLSKIITDTIGIVCCDDTGIYKDVSVNDMIEKYFEYLWRVEGSQLFCFVISIFEKLLELKQKRAEKFECFGGVLIKLMHKIFRNKKISEDFHKHFDEKIAPNLNERFGKNIKQVEDIFIVLVEMDVPNALTMCEFWFPHCFKKCKKWIIEELPKKASIKQIEPVVNFVVNKLVCVGCKVPNEYVAFMEEYLVLDAEEEEDPEEEEEEEVSTSD